MAERWIDVSAHNGIIDWHRVAASGVRGAVIRAGYGDSVSQQDTQFAANIAGAISAGLKIGVYWFSYADSVADARKEWAVCRQIIEPYKSHILFVASDYEYDSYNYYKRVHGAAPSNVLINQMVNAFLDAVKADGYAGVLYTNNDYRRNIFSAGTLASWGIWLADYTGGPDVPCAMQQTGSTGSVPGISGNVDMDTCFKVYGTAAVPTPAKMASSSAAKNVAVDAFYRVRTTKGIWLGEIKNLTDFAGRNDGVTPITDVAIRVSAGSVKYRVHVLGGGWLNWITGCNIYDRQHGYAGNGHPIDAIEVYYFTPNNIRPYKRAKYHIAPTGGGFWSWQLDDQITGGQDGYAGMLGRSIAKLQICIE